MSLRPSAEAFKPGLALAGAALGAFLVFRLILPPRPAAVPLFAALGFVLVAAVLYSMRGKLFVRSWAFALVGAAAYALAWNRGVPTLYAVSAGCFAIVVVSHLLPHWVVRRIEGRIAATPWIWQGEAAGLRVVLSNPSATIVRMLELEVPFEGTVTGQARARALIVQLAPGAERELTLRTPPLRRGRRFAGPLTVRTGFPLGLAFAESVVAGSGQHVWVYPRLFTVAFVPIAGEQFLDMGEAISPRSGGVEEFAGVREYRYGDSRRHVHWRASAHRGELVVKEFTRRAAATVTIAMDVSTLSAFGEGIETTTEHVISVAASVARYVLEQGHYVQVALCGEGFSLLGPLRGGGRFEDVLRWLALAEPSGTAPFTTWLPRIFAAAPPDSTVVLVYTDSGGGDPGAAGVLRGRGVLVVPVAIDAESFGAPQAKAKSAPPRSRAHARRLRMGDDPARVFRP